MDTHQHREIAVNQEKVESEAAKLAIVPFGETELSTLRALLTSAREAPLPPGFPNLSVGSESSHSARESQPRQTRADTTLPDGTHAAAEPFQMAFWSGEKSNITPLERIPSKPNSGKPSDETILPSGASFNRWPNGETETNYWNGAQGVVHTWPNGESETATSHGNVDTVVHKWTDGGSMTTQTIPDGGGITVTNVNPDGSGTEVTTGQHSSFSEQPVTRPHPDEYDNTSHVYGPGGELVQSTYWSSLTGNGSIDTLGPNGQMISRPAQIGPDGVEINRPGGRKDGL